jgi:hypothetical protein
MKFRPGFLKPTIKSLSGKRRNWAKANKFYLTGRNRINADLTVREIKRLEVEISWTIPLVRCPSSWLQCSVKTSKIATSAVC